MLSFIPFYFILWLFLARGNRVAQVRSRSRTNPNQNISNSVDQELDNDSNFCSSPYSAGSCSPYSSNSCQTSEYLHQHQQSNLETMSSTSSQSLLSSISEPANRRSCTDMSTQTDFSHLPTPLRKKAEKAAAATAFNTSQSKIPRPVMQRAKTLDSIPVSSKLKRRNSTNTGSCASRNQLSVDSTPTMPRALREKSSSNRPGMRREKSDVTGQRSKYRTTASPGPVRRNGMLTFKNFFKRYS